MKNKKFRTVRPWMESRFGDSRSQAALEAGSRRFMTLCQENAGDPRPVKNQTEKNLFPCLALYEGMQTAGISREEALAFLDESWSRMARPKARSMQIMAKLPWICSAMPGIYQKVTLGQFGEAAGFQAVFYDLGKKRCKFDMTRCLYCDVCRKYGCPELVPCFCHTDDVTSGNIHRRLKWNRTKTMGEGGDVCDFDLILLDK